MIWPFVTKQTEPAKAQSAPIAFSTADLELAAVAERAVAAFVDYLGADTMVGEIRDVKVLPGPKQALVNAFTLALALEGDAERRDALLRYGLLLSHFQEGVGDKPVRQMPDFSGDDEAILEVVLAHKSEFDRFNQVYPTAIAEAKQMAEKYQRSIDAAVRRGGA
ncbi:MULTISPECIES: hypothetical protein [Mesorhizobium]|uniref:Uncharacterized protein n=4 Tax=Mesorhizobium TaxID=68287 RepID=Q8KGX3_RHILI|nr:MULTISPECIES: hypothetical protein [Mesorhizobium]MBZ9910311.1 hypothetical protein [Mesorhizobium sp. BR115XR7A]QGX80528.1 hypothetical protein EB234_29580 [Mesorhizobium japonicum R7A]QJF04679.1 hypothetical protein R7A2020_29215 [Mesorhizobium japonicum R7A]QJF10748.1 hypothetical protein HID05_29205 [Mesorhizobium japonicum]QJI86621.1 hypothetical protein HKB46_29215 [Mesorhizobium japonicum]